MDTGENAAYDEAKQKELIERVETELKALESRNFLERFGLYMARVQVYELSLKQDLEHIFGIPEQQAARMNLSSILRHFIDHDIRAHPILYANIADIARQRNIVAHELLANAGTMANLAGIEAIELFQRDFDKWTFELELAYQQYSMLKETDMLYRDYGVKASNPYEQKKARGSE